MRSLVTGSIAALLLALAVAPVAVAAGAAETITVDATAPTRPFPHFWERMFGSGRAALTLRESYRDDLRAVRSVTALSYVRFHGIFNDELGVHGGPEREAFTTSCVDQVYDGLLANGARPVVELGFMPSQLASSNTGTASGTVRSSRLRRTTGAGMP
jgi:xylan 1,4-beta-xylosidase